ncbi:sirohydrochlorin chelatase [Alicyclobacillus fastidiosus]|uniref:Sirohydrochlorin chelatase n=1 Tax=Alicyclobacillus fastidiosus TaxID=392011 RepID=A0ABY6ZKP4_9BACL|nr:sirohydrochlorin chelatase [Alicyclobacillus fastidiosus]WAH42756.1 sirohydrochlorin chelatase [Alicyclobacillus fastidiosus]GMA64668.1 sirohydrochlorin ferrochelatase [Alicyclobacillus fastidiosus]
MTTAILFVGHGTRRQHGVDEFVRFVDAVKSLVSPSMLSSHAFLELQSPDIVQGIDSLVARGADHVVCIPLFLFCAGHMLEDIPRQLASAARAHPDVRMTLSEPYGTDAALFKALVERIAALSVNLFAPGTGILLLGRGNKEPQAQAVFGELGHELATHVRAQVSVGYLAGTGRRLEDTLTQMAAEGFTTIVVAPYLWFSGWLTDTLPERIAKWQATTGRSEIQIRISDHLGIHPDVVACVADRVRNYLV